MPILSNHRDAPDQVLQRAAQQDPWVMYLIVHQEVPLSPTELLLAATQATMRCAETFQKDPRWSDSFRVWGERSFRKVTLRARASGWSKLGEYDRGVGLVRGNEAVMALPPRLRSECGSLLKGLQVYNPETSALLPDEPLIERPKAPMYFVKNPDATMSIGKQVAQIAHAVLMCAWSSWATDSRYQGAFEAWRSEGYPAVLLPSSRWAQLHAEADGVVVRDAGLTEVDPGTATVLALPPGYPLDLALLDGG